MLKQVFSDHFELVVTPFGPWKIPNCLEKGPQNWVKKRVKNGFFLKSSRTIGGAQTSEMSLFLARSDRV